MSTNNDMSDFGALADALGAQDLRGITDIVHDKIVSGSHVPVYPLSELFPMIASSDTNALTELVNDIKMYGVNESIKITPTGEIIDGRNRIAAVQRAITEGVTPPFTVEILRKTPAQLDAWIISTNLHRRHLNASQRAIIASQMANATKATGGQKSGGATVPNVITVAEAAASVNVSPRQVKNANQVIRLAEEAKAPEIVDQVKQGTMTIATAQTVLKKKLNKAPAIVKPAPSPNIGMIAPVVTSVPITKPAKALTVEELATLKDLVNRASQAQLIGIKNIIVGRIK